MVPASGCGRCRFLLYPYVGMLTRLGTYAMLLATRLQYTADLITAYITFHIVLHALAKHTVCSLLSFQVKVLTRIGYSAHRYQSREVIPSQVVPLQSQVLGFSPNGGRILMEEPQKAGQPWAEDSRQSADPAQ
ncbi:uncharacterized protein BCR38DRAFT_209243 [Pseudomassariella vexata]|uniref:Uncharacterized protein n=1 Tax=Pseudomassariella vexata TaxID=1141098 RepID=A0A1Y2DY49_9PEZI|nr:uncharacterized protein BCR38DRAFT_209243 [Pseudomassariella vexata]ORY64201.1 hypothetical protein BCR38DRAFT_209243 [Pseudomassariella vexata]